MFTGLSAFPITPFKESPLRDGPSNTGLPQEEQIDLVAFEKLIANLVSAKVDSICAMGSTGLYPYLSLDEFHSVAHTTVENAGDIPVMVGIGSSRTRDVLKKAELAQKAGVSAVLLAPVSYHPLKEKEVLGLFEAVTAELSVPLCVYENPVVTNFTFSDALYQQITRLPNVAAIKIPGIPFATEEGEKRLATLRSLVPESIAIGVSADKFGAAGMAAGCDLWLTVLGGLFPNTVKRMMENAQNCTFDSKFAPLFELFVRNKGGLRVMATAAQILGYTEANCLPAPIQPLDKDESTTLKALINKLELD